MSRTSAAKHTDKVLPSKDAKPVLKWAGGKSRLLPTILSKLPSSINTYFEPFIGGAAVFFRLAQEQRFKHAVLSDKNPHLIDVYRALKKDVAGVVHALKRYSYDKDEYYQVRELNPLDLDLVERAARLIYLNRTGYNGLYRVNRSGQFNVPFGRYKNPKICDEPRLMAAARLLKGVELVVADFAESCANASRGDAIYFDPPYVPLSKTSNFTAYHSEMFSMADHTRLADAFGRLGQQGISAVLSNSETATTLSLYKQFELSRVLMKRPINSQRHGRGDVAEILVVNRPAQGRPASHKKQPARPTAVAAPKKPRRQKP